VIIPDSQTKIAGKFSLKFKINATESEIESSNYNAVPTGVEISIPILIGACAGGVVFIVGTSIATVFLFNRYKMKVLMA
jgi:hypothetical protein